MPGCLALAAAVLAAQTPDPVEFYKGRIAPLLEAKCAGCHGQAAMGGLRLDSREAVMKGGQSGPAISPGAAAQSLLIRVVSHTHENIKMPPGGKLSGGEIADLTRWVEAGAHFAGRAVPAPAAPTMEQRRQFWSFQPPRKVAPPAVRDSAWARTPADRFLLAALEARNLAPAPPATRAALLRRVTIDLTGLPPTAAEYAAFSADKAPDAFEKVVDRLLASEHYGERWGRHWLDVARYADADGISVAPMPFANAWRYRDWVVDAFNRDMPFDEFVQAQIAGDLMEKPGERRLTPGVGYLALGPWFHTVVEPVKARADELQDRIDAVSRGLLGLTVACARCHDHKYDPIPARDYYGIGGVLAATEYREEPLAPAATVAAYDAADKRVKGLEADIGAFHDAERKKFRERHAADSGRYLLAAWRRKHKSPEPAEGLDAKLLDRWASYLDREHDHTLLRFWPGLESGQQAEAASRDFQKMVDALIAEHRELTEYNERIIEASKKSTDPYDIYCKGCRAETKALARDKYVFLGDLFDGKSKTNGNERASGVLYLDEKELTPYLDQGAKDRLETLRADLAAAKKALPERYPFLHILADTKEAHDMPLHRRGDPYNPGDIVPRHFLSVLGKPEPAALDGGGSGRLELARQIASRSNPLTARVMVNRVWQHHFGAGLVRTLSNFGAAGDRPSHPELLDFLAVEFMEDGWSVKRLHRRLLLSSAYAMSSVASARALAADADNRLLSRFNRRRMDVEALRDSMLFTAGNLQLDKGGPAVAWDKEFRRRTLYGEVSRFRTERLLTLFDFPDPSIHAEKRVATNTSVQRLFFLNSGFIEKQAAGLAARLREAAPEDAEAQVRACYMLLFGRAAEPREIASAMRFLGAAPTAEALTGYAQVLLSSSEFSFVD